MKHLTDETLNEYLDDELTDRAPVEEHLAICADCSARLTALQALFTELDSLLKVELTHPLAARLILPSRQPALPRSLRLAVTLQAALAVIAMIIAAPFVIEILSPYLGAVQMPSFTEVLLQAQSQWIAWLDTLSTLALSSVEGFHFPPLPAIPAVDVSSLYLALALAGASILWLVGNGLLLRKQIK